MSGSVLEVAIVATALGCGVVGGVFFAFSTFVMRALALMPPAQGVRAMQLINVTVLNKWFFAAFLGTAAASVLLGVVTIVIRPLEITSLVLGGSILYFVGTFIVTIAFNVPRNERLAELSPDTDSATNYWTRYLKEWTAWNHVRTLASLLAALTLTASLLTHGATPP